MDEVEVTGLCPECGSEAPGARGPGIHPWTVCTVCGRAWGVPPRPDGEPLGWWIDEQGPSVAAAAMWAIRSTNTPIVRFFETRHEALLFLEKWLTDQVPPLPTPEGAA